MNHLASVRSSCLPVLLAMIGGTCAPLRREPSPPTLRIVVISDLNSSYGSTTYPAEVAMAVRRIAEEWKPALVLIAGDMVAGQSPRLADSVVRSMWRAFDSVVARPLRDAGVPMAATFGNHDGSAYPAHARDRRLAVEYWRGAPRVMGGTRVLDGRHFPLRHTLVVGDAFVAVWDATNQESGTEEDLLAWLRDVLASREARGARHRIVLAHLPLYAVAEGRNRAGEVLAGGDSLRARLEAWGATLFVSGHHHAYYPGRRGSLELLHAGAIGDGPRPYVGGTVPTPKTVSVLELQGDSVAITTYLMGAGAGARDTVALRSLPAAICGVTGRVVRRDLREGQGSCTSGVAR